MGVTAWAAPAILQTVSAGAAVGSAPPAPPVPDDPGALGEPPAPVSPGLPAPDPLPPDLPALDIPSLSGTEPGARVLGETLTRGLGAGGGGGDARTLRVAGRAAGGSLPRTGAELEAQALAGVAAVVAGAGLVGLQRAMAGGGSAAGAGPGSIAAEVAIPRVVRTPDALWRRAGPDGVVVLADAGPPLVLRGWGVRLWDLLIRPVPVQEAAAMLSVGNGPGDGPATPEVLAVLEELRARGVVVAEDEAV